MNHELSQEFLTRQQIAYEAGLPYLRSPDPSTVDIENLAHHLSTVTRPTLGQARTILGAATERVPFWVEAVGADRVIDMLVPSLNVQRDHVEASGEQEAKDAFTHQASQIVSGIISTEFDYSSRLRGMIRENQLGERGHVLAGALSVILPVYQEVRELPRDQAETGVGEVAEMLDDLIEVNPDLARGLQPVLPAYILFAYEGFRSRSLAEALPRVHRLLIETLDPKQIQKALAEIYLMVEVEDQDRLKVQGMRGEFGDPIDALSSVCTLATEDPEDHPNDGIAEDVWIELMDLNRMDRRLRPLREKLMTRDWYWNPESALATLIETVEALGLRGQNRIAGFVERHEVAIIEALKRNASPSEWQRYGSGIEVASSRGEFKGRLAAMLTEIRNIKREEPDFLLGFSNSLLLASLHTPYESDKSPTNS